MGGGGRGLQTYRPKGQIGLQVQILVQGRPRAGAEASGKAFCSTARPDVITT